MINSSNTVFYVVNLKKDFQRRLDIEKELLKQKINKFNFIDAVDGNQLSEKTLKDSVYQNNSNYYKWHIKLSKSQNGCALSHIKIYKKFIKSNYDYAFIFEDDAIFRCNFNDEVKKLISDSFTQKKNQILLLGELKNFFKKPIVKSKNFKVVDTETAYFTHAYVINKGAANKILNFNFPVKTVADNHLMWKLYLSINIYGVDPIIVDQNKDFYSNIEYENIFKDIKQIEKSIPFYQKQILWKRKIYKLKVKILKIFCPFLFDSHLRRN